MILSGGTGLDGGGRFSTCGGYQARRYQARMMLRPRNLMPGSALVMMDCAAAAGLCALRTMSIKPANPGSDLACLKYTSLTLIGSTVGASLASATPVSATDTLTKRSRSTASSASAGSIEPAAATAPA